VTNAAFRAACPRAWGRGVGVLATATLPASGTAAQTLEPPPAIRVEGVPTIPQALVDEVARYTNARSARRESTHPVRQEFLISTRFGDTEQLHRVRLPGGAWIQLTFPPNRSQLATYQPTNGEYFLFFKDRGGNERYQMYRYDFRTGLVTLLSDGTSRNSPGAWSPDGRLAAYRSNRRTGRHMDIYVIDPLRPDSSRLAVQLEGGIWRVSDWSPSGRQLLLTEMRDVDSRLWLADLASGVKTPVPTGGDSAIRYDWALFSSNGRGIFALTDRGSGFQHLTFITPGTGQHTDLTPSLQWDVEQFDVSPKGDVIAFTANQAGVSRLYLYDVAQKRSTLQTGVPVGIIRDLEWHAAGRSVGFSLESSAVPGDVYSFDVATKRLTRWTHSEVGGLNLDAVPAPELITWKSFDGTAISGFLYRPPARFAGRRPVMIRIHGGPLAQSRPQFLGQLSYYVNEMGIAIVYPNVRGSTGYGRAYQDMDNGARREGAVRDIGALLDWIGQRLDLDPRRVFVTGASYGGFMSLAVATTYADRIACAASTVGISDLAHFMEHAQDADREGRRAEYGDERDPATLAVLRELSPLNRAGQIKRPLFVAAGANDARVTLDQSRRIVEAARESGAQVWYMEAANEGHGYERTENVSFLFYATVLFVRGCLGQ